MIPRDLLKKIRKIQITTLSSVQELFAGQYHSAFKGSGMEFEEVRHYVHGDDVRAIDWNVTARTGIPHVKIYREERELTVILAVDVSASARFGSCAESKREIAAQFCATIAFSAIKNNDKVGVVFFSEGIEKYIPPKKGIRQVLRVIREVLFFTPVKTRTNIAAFLKETWKLFKKRCVVFVVSDFMDSNFEKALAVTSKRHDVIGAIVVDPREEAFPEAGLVRLKDIETGADVLVDTGSGLISLINRQLEEAGAKNAQIFKKLGLDSFVIRTGEPFAVQLKSFFRARKKRLAR